MSYRIFLYFVLLFQGYQNMAASSPSPYFLGVGAPIVDLVVSVPQEFLCHVPEGKGGSIPIEEKAFHELVSLLPSAPALVPGGSCANTIKGLAHLGGKSRFFGRVGLDSTGQFFRDHLEESGVEPLLIPCSAPTGQVLSFVTPDGDRTQRSLLGASNMLVEEDLHPKLFQEIQCIHLEGYLIRNGQLLETAIRMAKEAGVFVSLDLGSYELVRQYRERFLSLIRQGVDLLFANGQELGALTGKDPVESVRQLAEDCLVVVGLLGERGCVVAADGEAIEVPVQPVEVVDTTGAGDLFASGFLFGYFSGYPIDSCAKLGNLLGSAVVQTVGAEIPDEKWPFLIQEAERLARCANR